MSVFPSEINDDSKRLWKGFPAQLQIKFIYIFDTKAYYPESQALINPESIKARTARRQIIKTIWAADFVPKFYKKKNLK